MLLDWRALLAGRAAPPDGAEVLLAGQAVPLEDAPPSTALVGPEPACCVGCRPDPATVVEILLAGPAPLPPGPVRLRGRWRSLPPGDPAGWRWQLRDARAEPAGPWLGRRGLLAAAPLACLPAASCAADPAVDPSADPAVASAAGRALVAAATPADLHSHAGRVILGRRVVRPFEPVAAPMRAGGVRLVALAIVADTPTIHVTPDRRIEAFRDPAPGELAAHGEAAFARLAALVRQEELAVVTDRAGLARATAPDAAPAILVASEGADWLEGRLDGLAPAVATHGLRLLQLVHYRVNALGDIQTAPPQHDGLTGFGAEVIRACNRLGVVVDVAHGTFPLVQRAVEVTRHPLVLSHTAVTARPRPFSRWVTPDHARLVAATGGVVGVWPITGGEPTMAAYAASIARMVDAIGIDHVGLGTDMLGLLGTPALGDYREVPALADALLRAGFAPAEAAKLLGGNAMRVFAAVLPG